MWVNIRVNYEVIHIFGNKKREYVLGTKGAEYPTTNLRVGNKIFSTKNEGWIHIRIILLVYLSIRHVQ
jgi:hypothetical protein